MKIRLRATAVLLLASQPLFAAQTSDGPQTIIVTATRTAQTADEALASVTVITREDIERRQATSVQDLLQGTVGLAVTNNGGPGKQTSIHLRGSESDHVLVLIDGVEVGSATSGAAAIQDIPLEQIERIEIVRGPRSSLYGSEAIGGVIQIFTRRGGGKLSPFMNISSGSYSTYNGSLGIAGSNDYAWFNVSASGIDSESFSARVSDSGVVDPDKDGYRNVSGSASGGFRLSDIAELDLHWLRAKGESDFDGYYNSSKSLQNMASGKLRFSPSSLWQLTLSGGRNKDESDNYADGVFKSRYDTERKSASLQNDISIGSNQLLTFGVDYQHVRVDSTTDYAVSARNNKGGFGQYQGSYGANDVQFSLRGDDNGQFGRHATGGASWGYTFGGDLRVMASYGTAFKAPTFNELYFPNYGNPALQPEESQSVELGLSRRSGMTAWSLNAYRTDIKNLIAYDAAKGLPSNIDRARIRGVEATWLIYLAGWRVDTSVTLLEPRSRSTTYARNVLPRRARQAVRFDLDRAFGKYRLGGTVVAQGKRYDDLENQDLLASYATVALRAEYALKAWRLQGRIENLFNKDYQTAASYNQPGRSVFMTLRYQR